MKKCIGVVFTYHFVIDVKVNVSSKQVIEFSYLFRKIDLNLDSI